MTKAPRPIALPPDPPLQSLAALINARLPQGAAVNFYRLEQPDGSIITGMVFSCGDRRANVTTRNQLGDGDADEIVRSVTDWIARVRHSSMWTIDPTEAA
jgi:hypothetical protein